MLRRSAAYAITRCLSVRLTRSYIVSKRINIISSVFFTIRYRPSHTILDFPYQTSRQYSDGVGKTRDSRPVSGFIACCQRCDRQVLSTRCRRTVASCDTCDTAGSKWRSLLIAGDDDEMLMTRSLKVTPKTTTEQHLIARSDKSVAYVTNDKKLRSTFCTIEANYWQTRSIARPLCDSRASFLLLPRKLGICLDVLVCLWAVLFTKMYKYYQMFWKGNPCDR